MNRLLVDANVLLRLFDREGQDQMAATASLHWAGRESVTLCYAGQTVGEFVQVATRSRNGYGWPPARAFDEFERLANRMTWLADPRESFVILRRLYDEDRVRGGSNVHDARLAALALHHELDGILTFNGRDFARTGLPVVDPRTVAAD